MEEITQTATADLELQGPAVDGELEPDPGMSFANGLRALADLLDEHPGLDDHCLYHSNSYDYHVLCRSREEMVAARRLLGGSRWDKTEDDSYFKLTRDMGAGVKVEISTSRGNVCERVKVGTKKVMKKVEEGVDVSSGNVIQVPMVEVEEDVYEWSCPESILADADAPPEPTEG